MKLNRKVATAGFAILMATLLVVQVETVAKDKKPKEQIPATQLVWPPPPDPARIKWVGEWRNEFDVGAKKRHTFIDRLAGTNEQSVTLVRPLSVAVDDQGVVFVGDGGLGVVGIDPGNKKMWLFASVANRVEPNPAGIAVDSQFVYVTDATTNTLRTYDKQGHPITSIGAKEGLQRPVGVAVDEGQNLIILVNGGSHSVLLIDRKTLSVLKTIGGRGEGPGKFNFPTYCCFIPGTGFAVVDTGNFRVQIFDNQGRYIRKFGELGDKFGNLSRPKGIAIDQDKHIYLVDAVFANYQVFNLEGRLLTFVGQGGPLPGMFQVPNGIAVSKTGTIYVADEINNRVQIFQYLGEGGEKEEGKSGKTK